MEMSSNKCPVKSKLTTVYEIFQFSSQVPNKTLYQSRFIKHRIMQQKILQNQIHIPRSTLHVLRFLWRWRRQTARLNIKNHHKIIVMSWTLNFNKCNYKWQIEFCEFVNFSHDNSDEMDPQLQPGSQSSLHLNICHNRIELLRIF
jgi:hypothetical protein